jgi:hypothetical protein
VRVIVAGGRDYLGDERARAWLRSWLITLKAISVLSGGCSGADTLGESVALELGLAIEKFPADWVTYGKAAGPIRNEEMANIAGACILFPGGSGTRDIKRRALAHGMIPYEYEA